MSTRPRTRVAQRDPPDDTGTQEELGASGQDPAHRQAPRPESSWADLMEIVRRSLEAQQVQANKQEQWWKAMQHQFHLLQEEVHTRARPVPDRTLHTRAQAKNVSPTDVHLVSGHLEEEASA